MSKEKELHLAFEHLQIEGEWFKFGPELEYFIETHATPYSASELVRVMPVKVLSVSVSADVAHQLRIFAATPSQRVTQAVAVEAALRAFLALPKGQQTAKLKGYGRRRVVPV